MNDLKHGLISDQKENDMAGRTLNKVQLIGRLGRDPELRYTTNGIACATLSVATNESYKEGDEWKERTEWHRVILWGRQAEFSGEYLAKGSQIYIEGRLQTRKWADPQSGQDKYTTEIIARELMSLGGKGDSGGASQGPPHPADDYAPAGSEPSDPSSPPADTSTSPAAPAAPAAGGEEDIPF